MSTPPQRALEGEENWQADPQQIHSQDTIAQTEDAGRSTMVTMWRSNTAGDNSVAWQVVQSGHAYPIQGASATSRNAPSLVTTRGYVFAFHRGDQNQIFWAFGALATPASGNFRLSPWMAIPGVSTSLTPVATVVNDQITIAYRGSSNNQIYSIHSPVTSLLNSRNSGWTGNTATGFTSDSSPAIASLGTTSYLVYTSTGARLMISQQTNFGAWTTASQVAGSPATVGRPSIAIAGSTLDIVALGNDPDAQFARSIYRRQFAIGNNRSVNPLSDWTADPQGWRSISPVLIYGIVTVARVAQVWISMRGAGNTNGQHFNKLLTSKFF